MSENENQQSLTSSLCKNGCGFFGSSQFDGMCSVCYKETLKKKQKQDEGQIQTVRSNSPLTSSLCASPTDSAELKKRPSLLRNSNQFNGGLSDDSDMTDDDKLNNKRIKLNNTTTSALPFTPSSSSLLESSLNIEDKSPGPLEAGAQPTVTILQTKIEAKDDSATGSDTSDAGSGKSKKNRCGVCKKKVGLTGFTCRCNGLFCSLHRYSDKHECNFDYQSLGQEEIRKANPQVVSSKVEKL